MAWRVLNVLFMQKGDCSRYVGLMLDLMFSPENLEQAVQLLVSGIGRTEAKPGCRECLVARDAASEGHLRYSEAWDVEASFRRHIRSEEFQRVMVAMDMCSEEPRITIGELSGRKGMEYLKELHNGGES